MASKAFRVGVVILELWSILHDHVYIHAGRYRVSFFEREDNRCRRNLVYQGFQIAQCVYHWIKMACGP